MLSFSFHLSHAQCSPVLQMNGCKIIISCQKRKKRKKSRNLIKSFLTKGINESIKKRKYSVDVFADHSNNNSLAFCIPSAVDYLPNSVFYFLHLPQSARIMHSVKKSIELRVPLWANVCSNSTFCLRSEFYFYFNNNNSERTNEKKIVEFNDMRNAEKRKKSVKCSSITHLPFVYENKIDICMPKHVH